LGEDFKKTKEQEGSLMRNLTEEGKFPIHAEPIHLQIKVNNTTPRKTATLRIYPLNNDISEPRFWCDNRLIDTQKIKNHDLKTVHF
jgi:hypothetical protein